MAHGVDFFLPIFYTFAHMALSRTRLIIGSIATVVALSLGYAAWLGFGPSAKYRGLTTHMQVDMDDATRAYAENQLKTAQASLAAAEAQGGDVDLNKYALVAHYAFILGDLVTAREALEAELKGNPLNYGAMNSYGNVLVKMGDYAKARTAFEKAIQLGGGGEPESFYVNLVDLLLTQYPAEKDTVKTILESYVAVRGQTPWAMLQLGRWYQAAGDCTRAIDHLTVAKTLSPKNQNIADELQALRVSCQ
jgi:Tfp pilus assembly protein PilF